MCMKAFIKIVTGVLSIAFLILGIAFLIVGLILQFGLTTIVVQYISTYTAQLNTALAAANVSFDINQYIGFLPSITSNLAVVFIIMGGVTAGVAILGLVAICCENKLALIIYIVIMAVLVVGQLTLVIIYYAARDTFSTRAKEYMMSTITTKYTGHNNTNMETILWNIFHMSLSCCGINNGMDFQNATMWSRSVNYSSRMYTINYPLTCCKTSNYSACLMTNHSDAMYSNWNIGCYSLIETVVQLNIVYASLGTGAVILLQLLILDFAIHLCRKKGKSV